MNIKEILASASFFIALLTGIANPANAALTLTAASIAQGFTLTTFASGFPTTGHCCGPLGIGFTSSGGVLVSDYTGTVAKFATNTDNQTYASASITGGYGWGLPVGIAQYGGKFYMADRSNGGRVIEISSDGAFVGVVATGIPLATGIVADPATGKLYVSGSNSNSWSWGTIFEVDPSTGSATDKKSQWGFYDGLTISGSTLYAEGNNSIIGYNLSTFAEVYNSGFIPGGPDGVAIGTGSLSNLLFINSNDGTFWQQDVTDHALTLFASGGSRGDFVYVDPNGTLLITQTDSIMRLTAPVGGGFEHNGNVPEPGSLALMGLALASLASLRRRMSQKSGAQRSQTESE